MPEQLNWTDGNSIFNILRKLRTNLHSGYTNFHSKQQWSFQMSQLFTSGGQSIGASASTSVLPMNTQDWSPLGPHHSAILLLDTDIKTTIMKIYLHTYVHFNIIYNIQEMKINWMSSDKWIKKMWCIYTYISHILYSLIHIHVCVCIYIYVVKYYSTI